VVSLLDFALCPFGVAEMGGIAFVTEAVQDATS
jgi:hypothetical protein